MNLIEATLSKLSNIQFYLQDLPIAQYREPLEILSFASIGEHTRHIIEFYQCLLNQSKNGTVNYDLRNRKRQLQEDPRAAGDALRDIMDQLPNSNVDQRLKLQISYDLDQAVNTIVDTSLERTGL